jgi:DNA-binding CsgD family transcriptional regulator
MEQDMNNAGSRERPISAPDIRKLVNDETITWTQGVVLEHLIKGDSNKVIAYELSISEATIKAHVSSLIKKMGQTSRTKLVSSILQARNSSDAPPTLEAITKALPTFSGEDIAALFKVVSDEMRQRADSTIAMGANVIAIRPTNTNDRGNAPEPHPLQKIAGLKSGPN